MSGTGASPGGPAEPRSAGQSAALPVAAWLAVFLLAIACVLLWRAGNDDGDGRPAAQVQGPPPELPEKTQTSAEELLRELDRLTRRLDAPLKGVQAQLGEVSNRLVVVEGLPALLDRIARNTSGFETLPSDLRALTREARRVGRINSSLREVLTVLQSLQGAAVSLSSLSGDIRAIRQTFDGVSAALAPLTELALHANTLVQQYRDAINAITGIRDTTAASFRQVVENLEQMRRELQRIRECTERPVACNAPAGG